MSNNETIAKSRTYIKGWMSRAAVIMLLDVLCVLCSFMLALLLRFDLSWSKIEPQYIVGFKAIIIPSAVITVAVFWALRLYHSIWSFASFSEFSRLVLAWVIIAVLNLVFTSVVDIRMPISYWLAGGIFCFASTTALRFSWRFLRLIRLSIIGKNTSKRVMVIGAGDAGRTLIREMRMNPKLDLNVCCAIDDNSGKWGRYIDGVPIIGGRNKIIEACEDNDIDQIVFAIPSASGETRREILEISRSTGCEIRVVPGVYQIIDGEVSVSSLRNVKLEDLLGRDPIIVDSDDIRSHIEGKVVLVTGGGGSIGSELCRQIARDNPRQLIIFDIYENNAYAIQQELQRVYPGLNLVVLIGSVRSDERVRSVFHTYRPDIVFHAAAHKHVPLMEDSPNEAIKNNVFGTLVCARAAADYNTSRFVLISTDKAVNPTNIMGASKRLCEMVIQMMDRKTQSGDNCGTEFVAVRFGNVLGSNGSVVPLFEKQIAEGGPVTVTDKRITRFFMTIPEAVSLVLQAACYASGGEIFVLDMGDPVRIDDMARKLIRLAGLVPDVDIKIVYTGLRPGEKLYEEKLMAEEGLRQTPNNLIHIAEPIEMDDDLFADQLERLDEASKRESMEIRSLVAEVVPTYHPELGGGAS